MSSRPPRRTKPAKDGTAKAQTLLLPSWSSRTTIMTTARPVYKGTNRGLVLAFDIGTTYSGISYSILEPGQVPEIKRVTRFPAQEKVGSDSKIPTILYYDKEGNPVAVGAEATREGLSDLAEDEGWTRAEWFKMHMRPKHTRTSEMSQRVPPLPPNKTVIDLFADVMHYLHECAKGYIQESHPRGMDLWQSVEGRIEYVLTHPNGWEGAQQTKMRKAAVQAGLVPNTDEGRARVHFVTEGEASLHFCIQRGLMTEAMKGGDGVVIVDAGGGTVDLSAYGQKPGTELGFEEVASAQCHFQGSIFVTNRARLFLKAFLKDSKFVDDVDGMAAIFDKTTKLTFRNSKEPQFIKFGRASDRDLKLGIRGGQIKLQGSDVAKFFEPSVTCIIDAIQNQRSLAQNKISSVFLVGGFATSDWLFSQLKECLEPLGLDVCRPDGHTNKAVPDGAVSYYIDHLVSARVSRFAYGVECHRRYNENDAEDRRRLHRTFLSHAGDRRLAGQFSAILHKNVQVTETQVFRHTYFRTAKSRSELYREISTLLCYRGASLSPRWMDAEPEVYTTLCTVEADMTSLADSLQLRYTDDGRPFFKMDYEVILSFGLTELKAQVCWKINGEEKRGPAKIIYETDVDDEKRDDALDSEGESN